MSPTLSPLVYTLIGKSLTQATWLNLLPSAACHPCKGIVNPECLESHCAMVYSQRELGSNIYIHKEFEEFGRPSLRVMFSAQLNMIATYVAKIL